MSPMMLVSFQMMLAVFFSEVSYLNYYFLVIVFFSEATVW